GFENDAVRVYELWKTEFQDNLSLAVNNLTHYARLLQEIRAQTERDSLYENIRLITNVRDAERGRSSHSKDMGWDDDLEVELEFGKQIPDQGVLERVYKFDKDAYVDKHGQIVDDIPFELFLEWWHAFPSGFLCSSRDSEPIAVVGLFPVTKDWADDFLDRKASEFDLDRKIIDKGKNDRAHWYLSGISSDKSKPYDLGARLPCVLGYSLFEWLRFNAKIIGARNITMVSEGTTPIGEKLLLNVIQFELTSEPRSFEQKPRF